MLLAVREALNCYTYFTSLMGTVPTCGKPKIVMLLQFGIFWLASVCVELYKLLCTHKGVTYGRVSKG